MGQTYSFPSDCERESPNDDRTDRVQHHPCSGRLRLCDGEAEVVEECDRQDIHHNTGNDDAVIAHLHQAVDRVFQS